MPGRTWRRHWTVPELDSLWRLVTLACSTGLERQSVAASATVDVATVLDDAADGVAG
jgi:hypothetical protein